jgi:hypothetical protein
MRDRTHSASTIETLRVAVKPGASTITQLAAALMRHGRTPRAGSISVADFFFPYAMGFPVLAYPGRKPLAPVYPYRPLFR